LDAVVGDDAGALAAEDTAGVTTATLPADEMLDKDMFDAFPSASADALAVRLTYSR